MTRAIDVKTPEEFALIILRSGYNVDSRLRARKLAIDNIDKLNVELYAINHPELDLHITANNYWRDVARKTDWYKEAWDFMDYEAATKFSNVDLKYMLKKCGVDTGTERGTRKLRKKFMDLVMYKILSSKSEYFEAYGDPVECAVIEVIYGILTGETLDYMC